MATGTFGVVVSSQHWPIDKAPRRRREHRSSALSVTRRLSIPHPTPTGYQGPPGFCIVGHQSSPNTGRWELLNGTLGFIGGAAFAGMTCSALAAGVMALGLMLGRIENSYLHVLHMVGLMAVRGEWFADDVNAFNGSMNRGNRLSQWFTAEFGSNQCAAITQCDFSTAEGVQRYVEGGGAARCSTIAERVASRVLSMVQPADAGV